MCYVTGKTLIYPETKKGRDISIFNIFENVLLICDEYIKSHQKKLGSMNMTHFLK